MLTVHDGLMLSVNQCLLCFPRHEFDSEQIPDLSRDVFKQDIHSVGSLCKLYFRELPNPLLTYQLYERFSVSSRILDWDWYLGERWAADWEKNSGGDILNNIVIL